MHKLGRQVENKREFDEQIMKQGAAEMSAWTGTNTPDTPGPPTPQLLAWTLPKLAT